MRTIRSIVLAAFLAVTLGGCFLCCDPCEGVDPCNCPDPCASNPCDPCAPVCPPPCP